MRLRVLAAGLAALCLVGMGLAAPAGAARTAAGIDADTVDGFDAVGCQATVDQRAGKLVATCDNGRLPNDIILLAPNSRKLGGETLAEVIAHAEADLHCTGCVQAVEIAPGAVTAGKLDTTGPAEPGQVLSFDGSSLHWRRLLPTWHLQGNAGTKPGSDFLGTTDDRRLVLKVNDAKGFELEPTSGTPNVLGGSSNNFTLGGVVGGTVAGGGSQDAGNSIQGHYGTVAGGEGVSAGEHASVGGGLSNFASGKKSTIGGGSGNFASALHATVAGGHGNSATAELASVGGGSGNRAIEVGATVAGGENNVARRDRESTAPQPDPVVGGGKGNVAAAAFATVSGGHANRVFDPEGTVGGGEFNTAGADDSVVQGGDTVAGGMDNTASGRWSTVGGGFFNAATGQLATIPGGFSNHAGGKNSFAAGNRAHADQAGMFSWADSVEHDFAEGGGADTFNVRATSGVWLWTNINNDTGQVNAGCQFTGAGNLHCDGAINGGSSRRRKHDFRAVSGATILSKLVHLEVSTWSYRGDDPSVRHIGPTSQDFYRAFGLGDSKKTIDIMDEAGVAFAAMKAMSGRMLHQRQELTALRVRVAHQNRAIGRLQREVRKLLRRTGSG